MLNRSSFTFFHKNQSSLDPHTKIQISGDTLLIHAARIGRLNDVKYWAQKFKRDININDTNSNDLSAVAVAAAFGHVDVVEYLIKRGADVTRRNNKNLSALDLAAANGQLNMVQHLVSHFKEPKDIYLAIRHALDDADEKIDQQRIAAAEFLLTHFVLQDGYKHLTNNELKELTEVVASYANIEVSTPKLRHSGCGLRTS